MSRPIKTLPLSRLRQEYRSHPLNREDLADNPFNQFELWLSDAVKAEIREPNAMTLATASSEGVPSSRTVLLRKSTNGASSFSPTTKAERLVRYLRILWRH